MKKTKIKKAKQLKFPSQWAQSMKWKKPQSLKAINNQPPNLTARLLV